MTKMSNYLENALVNATLRATAYTAPAAVYLALYTSDPTDSDTGAEVVTAGTLIANPTAAPTLATATTGGALAAATYYVVYTWVNAQGETLVSPEASIVTTGTTSTITATIPALPAGVKSANIYISTATGTETKQGSTTGTSYMQSAVLVAGTAKPLSNTTNAATAYARQAITFGAPSNGVSTNSANANFPQASAGWGTVSHIGIRDASTAGNLLYYAPANTARTILSGDTLSFLTGQVSVTLD